MLKIEFKDANCREAPLSDIDKIFQELEYKDTPLVRQFIEEIEHGKYYDTSDFIDRFGRHLSISDMSTGCKAAIILALGYRKPLDLTECGKNARDSIVQNCTSGHILLVDDSPFRTSKDTLNYKELNADKCDIEFDGYRFTSLDRLNWYLDEEWLDYELYGEGPDMSIPGIEKL